MLAGKEPTFKPLMGACGAGYIAFGNFNRFCDVFEDYRLLSDVSKCISIRVV